MDHVVKVVYILKIYIYIYKDFRVLVLGGNLNLPFPFSVSCTIKDYGEVQKHFHDHTQSVFTVYNCICSKSLS